MEHDLTKICQAIPVSVGQDVSTQASDILKGLTGEEVEFDIQTGNQPQLFPASITQLRNIVTVHPTNTSDKNGGFASAILQKVYVDGVEVQLTNNQYEVQSEDDGKTLTAVLSRDLFLSSSSSITLVYATDNYGKLSFTLNLSGLTSYQGDYFAVRFYSVYDVAAAPLDGNVHLLINGNLPPVSTTGGQWTVALYNRLTQTFTMLNNIDFYFDVQSTSRTVTQLFKGTTTSQKNCPLYNVALGSVPQSEYESLKTTIQSGFAGVTNQLSPISSTCSYTLSIKSLDGTVTCANVSLTNDVGTYHQIYYGSNAVWTDIDSGIMNGTYSMFMNLTISV